MKPHKIKSFPFSALTLLRRLFFLATRKKRKLNLLFSLVPHRQFRFFYYLYTILDDRQREIRKNKLIFYPKLNSNKHYGNKQS